MTLWTEKKCRVHGQIPHFSRSTVRVRILSTPYFWHNSNMIPKRSRQAVRSWAVCMKHANLRFEFGHSSECLFPGFYSNIWHRFWCLNMVAFGVSNIKETWSGSCNAVALLEPTRRLESLSLLLHWCLRSTTFLVASFLKNWCWNWEHWLSWHSLCSFQPNLLTALLLNCPLMALPVVDFFIGFMISSYKCGAP